MDQSTPVQQTPKPKNNTTALILLSIIAVLGVGFGIYGMVSGAKSSTPAAKTPDNSKQQGQEQQSQEQSSEEPDSQDISDNPEASKEERYQAFLNNLAKKPQGHYIYTLDKNGHYATDLSNDDFSITNDGAEICTDAGKDVVSAFVGPRGNAEPVVYFLKKNGDLYVCELADSGKYETKKIENAKYIIDFAAGVGVDGNTFFTYLIDIDGNVITMPNDLNL